MIVEISKDCMVSGVSYKKGDTVDVDPRVKKKLFDRGLAEDPKPKKPKKTGE
jgi:hypothetical protein